MNRLARVVEINNHSVTLSLLKSEKCAGCPSNCNEPLIDLFSLKSNQLTLSSGSLQYRLEDPDEILANPILMNQTIKLNVEDQDLLKSSAMYYLLPLIICLFTLSLGHYAGIWFDWSKDLLALFGLVLGLLLSYAILKSKAVKESLKFRPKVTILIIHGT